MLPILVQSILNISKRFTLPNRILTANFHHLNSPNLFNVAKSTFLKPNISAIVPSCGFKVMGKVKRRCKDCFIVCREQRMYVLCKTHPRHKQMSMVKSPRNTWILTHATQNKIRPW